MKVPSRGSAMLVVMALMVLLALVGASLLIMSMNASTSSKYAQASVGLSNCAMAVRAHLSANAKAGGTLGANMLTVTNTTTGQGITISGQHYESFPAGVTLVAPPQFGAVTGGVSVENLANALPLNMGTSAVVQTGVALCRDQNGREYEVEFSFSG